MDKRKIEEAIDHSKLAFTREPSADALRWLTMVRKVVVIYGVMNAIVLGSVVVTAATGGLVNTFMWVRAGILLAATPLLYRWSVGVEHGRTPAYQRLRKVSTVLPIALVVIDFIPGVCPSWYAWLQVCVAVTLFAMAGVLYRRDVRGLFLGGA